MKKYSLSETLFLLKPIDTSHVPDRSWANMINEVCNPFYLIAKFLVEGKITRLEELIYIHRYFLFNWVIKLKWHSEHEVPKIPKSPKGMNYRRCYPVLTELYTSVIDLCCLHYSPELVDYQNSADWFAKILCEFVIEAGKSLNKGKTVDRIAIQKQNVQLAKSINPINREEFPHTWKLIEIAKYGIGNKIQESTEEELWQLFIQRRKAWATELKRPVWNAIRIEDENEEARVTDTVKRAKKNRVPKTQTA